MMLNWILSVDFARMLNCEKTTTLKVIEASNRSSIKTVGVMGFISGLIALLYQDCINFSLAVVSATIIILVKILFVHGREMNKLSLKATLAESSNKSAMPSSPCGQKHSSY